MNRYQLNEIQFRKGHVARADHHRHDKIPEHSRDRWNQEKPNHQRAVNGEELVIGFGSDEVALRREQFDAHQRRRHAGDRERKEDRHQIEQADAFVIGGEQPRANVCSALR